MVFPELTNPPPAASPYDRPSYELNRAKSPALHPMTNANKNGKSISGSAYGGDRAPSRQSARSGVSQTPLHPLTGIASRPPGSATSDHHHHHYNGKAPSSAANSAVGGQRSRHPHDHHNHRRAPSPARTRDEEFQPSRPHSTVGKRYTGKQLVDMIKTPRTSFTISPSVLADEVGHSHFHDEDLCVLLHAADDEYLHDVVKKAVRKAVRARLKHLGLSHEDEVCLHIY